MKEGDWIDRVPEAIQDDMFAIGAFDRPELARQKVFDHSGDAGELARRAILLAFQNACTGSGEEYQNAGAKYFVNDARGKTVFSIEVTPEGNDVMRRIIETLLLNKPELMRSWTETNRYKGYTKSAGGILTGDVDHIVKNIIWPNLQLDHYKFDKDPQIWKHFMQDIEKLGVNLEDCFGTDDKKFVVHMSPPNPDKVMMRLPAIEKHRKKMKDRKEMPFGAKPPPPPPPPPLPSEPIVDCGPTLIERFVDLFKGPIEKAQEKALEEAGINKRRRFSRDPMDDAMDEAERRLTALANEKDPDRALAEQERREELLNPDHIKARAETLPNAKPHEIMQWGWDAEKLFARRQGELHDNYIKGSIKAKSHTHDVTSRIHEMNKAQTAKGLLKRIWLHIQSAGSQIYPYSIMFPDEIYGLMAPRERFGKTLEFVGQLERAVEADITTAQEQIGFCSEASHEMDQYYRALKTYDRELKRRREPIIDTARQQADARFEGDDNALQAMHNRAVLDAGRNIDERLEFLGMALTKCHVEYGVYVNAMEHEKLAIDALQKLLRERLPKLERAVKRAIEITEDQDAMKAKSAGCGIDVDIEHELTPEQAETELKSIAAQVTLQIDVIEKIHAAIIHDERLVIEGKEPEALLDAREILLLDDNRPLALPAPSKPQL